MRSGGDWGEGDCQTDLRRFPSAGAVAHSVAKWEAVSVYGRADHIGVRFFGDSIVSVNQYSFKLSVIISTTSLESIASI